jgi:hypothetical protein
MSIVTPKIIFIVPYRNRKTHKLFFSKYMTSLLDDSSNKEDYEIYFSHQTDERPFNRGGIKNIGFLAVKQKYPTEYHNITFVFNDIDTVPFNTIFNYETNKGTVKHFYGFKYALGGIVSIKGSDFELINGYPNFWGWGMEDAILQQRCEKHDLIIDRSHFYPIGSPEILHLFDGVSRIINKNETMHSKKDNLLDGLKTIYKLSYNINEKSTREEDNIHVIKHNKINIINIILFECLNKYKNQIFHEYDLREPSKKILDSTRIINPNSFNTNNWSNIPFYPNHLTKTKMINKFGQSQTDEIIQNSLKQKNKQNINTPNINTPNINTSNININKYSPYYATVHKIKPAATGSVNIGLGGVKK